MKSILLIVPYFGSWPFWLDAYLLSVDKNPTIEWLFITDCVIPEEKPENVTFLKTTMDAFSQKVNSFFNTQILLSPRKICDLRPAFGELFESHIIGYDFWGFCDMDIIWGNIRTFITEGVLTDYDIISSRRENTSGHFTIFRNIEKVNNIYKSIPEFRTNLAMPELQRMDEEALTEYLKNKIKNDSRNNIRINWNSILCNQENGRDSHQEYYLDRWLWQNGKMINTKTGEEVMYLHFINWKRTMRYCEVKYEDNPHQFFISYNGMHYNAHPQLVKSWNLLKNVFDGYKIRESRRIQKKNIKRIFKRINSKFFNK